MRTVAGSDKNDMPNLDLLRSMAVLLVVVEHVLLAMHIYQIGSWNIFWPGVFGVLIFFVHTSLVLMWSLERKPDMAGFYIRRFFRIYPLAILAVLVTTLFRVPTFLTPNGDPVFHAPSFGQVVSNLLLIQNIHFRGSILGVMWSLALEVDMYVLLPFLFFFLRQKFALWPILLLWASVVFYDSCDEYAKSSNFIIFIPCFLSGIIAYVLFSRMRARLPAFLMPVLVVLLFIGFMYRHTWPNGWALTLVLGVTLPVFRQIRAKWLVRSSHQVAKYSYGIYLAHPFCITFALALLHRYNLAIRIGGILFSLAIVVVVLYHAIEKPFIDFGSRLAARREQRGVGARPVAG
jgi:peptidoglycan/LPS O-acetylase OafA/YrhL